MTIEKRQFAADTHTGLHRKQNEDCYAADADLGLWLVADGVGGHACGDVASDLVRQTVSAEVSSGRPLGEALIAAHRAVLDASRAQQGAEGMGSTAVALRVTGEDYELAWVGDSRAYLWDGQLLQLTTDHNRVGELLAEQLITEEEASTHPDRHVLTQSLGVSESMELKPGHVSGTLSPGQHLLLCSDGLTDELSDSLITQLLTEHQTPRAQVDALMSAALDAGGRDNVTVVIVGEPAVNEPRDNLQDPDSTYGSRRSATGGIPNDGHFPLRALLLLTALALLAVLFLL